MVNRAQALMSDYHFTVDGSLIEAWTHPTNSQRKDIENGGVGRHFQEQRKNDTPAWRKSTRAPGLNNFSQAPKYLHT